jgi:hypothetical protein
MPQIVDEPDIPEEILAEKPTKKTREPLLCVEFYGTGE